MKIVPSRRWTMEKRGTKRVEIAGKDDKRQIMLLNVRQIFANAADL